MAKVKKKTAQVVINGVTYDIDAEVREEAYAFVKEYDEAETQRIIDFLNGKMNKIDRKLNSCGYFFEEDIQNYNYYPEVIEFVLNKVFLKNIVYGAKLGQTGRAIYIDENYVRRSGTKPINEIKDLYWKHYENK